MSNLTALYPNDFIHIRLMQQEFPLIHSEQVSGSSVVTLKYLLILKMNRRAHYFWRVPCKCAMFVLEAGEILQRLQVVQTVKILISASTWSYGQHLCGNVGVWLFFWISSHLGFFFSPEEQAMSSSHGLQLLLYLANFKIPTKNKCFAMSQ